MMSSRRPRMGASPGVIGMLWRPAHSIVSLLPGDGTPTGGCGGRAGQEVGRVHEAVRRGVMLVEAHTVVAEPIHGLPGREMLGVGAHGHLGLEVPPREGPRKLLAVLEMVEVLGVGKKIEDEDPHGRQVCYKPGPSARPRPAIIQEERSSPWPPTPGIRWTSSSPTLEPRSRRRASRQGLPRFAITSRSCSAIRSS